MLLEEGGRADITTVHIQKIFKMINIKKRKELLRAVLIARIAFLLFYLFCQLIPQCPLRVISMTSI